MKIFISLGFLTIKNSQTQQQMSFCVCILWFQNGIYPLNMVESQFLAVFLHLKHNLFSTIEAFPCMTDGTNLVSLLVIPCVDGTRRLSWSLCCCCVSNAHGKHHRKPINQQQRKLLSCPVVCLAKSFGGRESVVSLCQLAHGIFNYLVLRHWMNQADLWFCSLPIYQKTINAFLYGPSPKHSWAPWPFCRISLLCL